MKDSITRIGLWSGPRNVSTALMYSFAQRPDTQVYDEPLYGFYLRQKPETQAYHPGAVEIMQAMETSGEKVVQMMLGATQKPVLFFKNMTHHLLDLDRSFMSEMVNVILTRNPEEMLPSFAEVIENPTLDDVGYQLHIELIEMLEIQNLPFIVLDSKNILLNPEKELRRLCKVAQIPFVDRMLSWEAGKRPEDGIWAPYWYKSVHLSTGFQKYKPKTAPFPQHLEPLLAACQPYYEKLSILAQK